MFAEDPVSYNYQRLNCCVFLELSSLFLQFSQFEFHGSDSQEDHPIIVRKTPPTIKKTPPSAKRTPNIDKKKSKKLDLS